MEYYWELRRKNTRNITALMYPHDNVKDPTRLIKSSYVWFAAGESIFQDTS